MAWWRVVKGGGGCSDMAWWMEWNGVMNSHDMA